MIGILRKIRLIAWLISGVFLLHASSDSRLTLEWCYSPEIGEDVLCGTFTVMENPLVRKGRKIKLNVIVLPARTSPPAPDPVFVFTGGPGAGAADWIDTYARLYDKLRNEREIVLVDQRGTGGSNALHCRRIGDPNSAQTYLQDMFPGDYVKTCRKELEERANLKYYHTLYALDDIDALRETLGYDRINITGSSFGSYTGLVYMKYYPDRVRAAYLDKVLPPHLLYPSDLAVDTETAMERLLSDCAADPDCAGDYPDLRSMFRRVLDRLARRAVRVPIRNPINGAPETVTFSRNNFIHGLRSMLYGVETSKWIPAFIRWADLGNYAPIAEYTADYLKWVNDEIMDGMHLCLFCTEIVPFIDFSAARIRARDTFMGTYRLDQLQSACGLWVRGGLPDMYHQPLESGIPTLLVSGEMDPTTPPHYAEAATHYLHNSLHIIIPNAGHESARVWEECLDDLVVQFFSQASVEELDPSCILSHTRPPFVSWQDYVNASMEKSSDALRGRRPGRIKGSPTEIRK